MSASNWTTCPRCMQQALEEYARQAAEVAAAYGQVPIDKFDWMRARLEESDPARGRTVVTFREDYEFYGAEDGQVVASYGGSCGKCGLSVSLHATKRFWPEDGAEAVPA